MKPNRPTADEIIRCALSTTPDLLRYYDQNTGRPAAPEPAADSKLRAPGDGQDEDDILSSNYLIKGWIDRGTDCLLFGHWNAGKSFVVLDMLACVALGVPWFGAKVRQASVLYLAYEGHSGMPKRIEALREKYPDLVDAEFAWWPMRHPLTSDKGRIELEAARSAFAGRFERAPEIVAIDPLRNALGGSDSDPDLVERLGGQMRALMAADGCTVLKVTHSGHGDKTRVRGDSGIAAAADTEIMVEAGIDGGPGTIKATKERDSAMGEVHFALRVVDLGTDDDGDPVTTCCVEESAAGPSARRPKLGPNPKRAFDKLCALSPSNTPIKETEWKAACLEFLPERSVRQVWYTIKETLQGRGYVVCHDDDGTVSRRMD